MTKRRPKPEVVEEELAPNEEFISKDTLDILVTAVEEDENESEPTVWVRFANFEDMEEAEEYATMLQEILPLLLFETTRLQ
jgi:hypothetical protein